MIVGKSAEFKEMPDPIMLELQLRATRNIASEKRQYQMGPRLEFLQQLKHAGKQLAFASRQLQREKMHVTVQKRAHVFRRCWNIMLLQYTSHDPRIGHSCDFDPAQVIGNSKALPERGYESLNAGAARMNQSAIDI